MREVLEKTGGLDRINSLFSYGYLLQTLATTFNEEVDQVLKQYGMKGGQLAKLFEKAVRSNDDYFNAFYGLITEHDEEQQLADIKKNCWDDMEKLREAFFGAFTDFPEVWNPDKVKKESMILDIEEKYGVKINRTNTFDYGNEDGNEEAAQEA